MTDHVEWFDLRYVIFGIHGPYSDEHPEVQITDDSDPEDRDWTVTISTQDSNVAVLHGGTLEDLFNTFDAVASRLRRLRGWVQAYEDKVLDGQTLYQGTLKVPEVVSKFYETLTESGVVEMDPYSPKEVRHYFSAPDLWEAKDIVEGAEADVRAHVDPEFTYPRPVERSTNNMADTSVYVSALVSPQQEKK